LQKDVDAQVAITEKFSKIAPKEIADFSNKKAAELEAQGASLDEIAKWKEGGIYRTALHGVSSGLTGGLGGALGAGVVAGGANVLEALQSNAEAALLAQGVGPEAARALAQSLAQATAIGVGAAVGGEAGVVTGLATDTNNRQLHAKEVVLIEKLAKEKAKEGCRGNADCEARAAVMWTDALERVATGMIDDKAHAENVAYLTELQKASSSPGSEGARGDLPAYGDMLKKSADILSGYAGKPLLQEGANYGSGGVQKFFSATVAQRADSSSNLLFGGAANSIVIGKELRDENRVENLSAINGSAIKDYFVEENVLSGKLFNAAFLSIGRLLSVDAYFFSKAKATSSIAARADDVNSTGPATSAVNRVGLREGLAMDAGIPRNIAENPSGVWGSSLDDLKQSFTMDGATVTTKAPHASSSGNAQIFTVENSATGIKEVQFSPASGVSTHTG
jgi:hypothetical protein